MKSIVNEIKTPINVFIQGATGCGKSFFVKKNLYKRFFEHTDIAIAIVFHKDKFIKEFKKKTLFKPFFLNVIELEDFVNSKFTVSSWQKNLVVCELDIKKHDKNISIFNLLDTIIKDTIIPKISLIYVDEPTYISKNTLTNIIEQFRKKVFCCQGFEAIGLNEDFIKINFSKIMYGLDYRKEETRNLKRGEFILS